MLKDEEHFHTYMQTARITCIYFEKKIDVDHHTSLDHLVVRFRVMAHVTSNVAAKKKEQSNTNTSTLHVCRFQLLMI